MKKGWIFSTLFAAAMFSQSSFAVEKQPVIELDEAKVFINEMVDKHQFNRSELETLFTNSQIQPSIIKAISRPFEALPWHRYRQLFVTDSHVASGIEFWNQHQSTLERAEREYGVPAEIIVAILGVETRYGKHKGGHAVVDALSTLAFKYPKRAKFFRSELEQFLLLTKEQKLDPASIEGSYAGAMGVPQFISSSYRHYAVDFNGSGSADLMNNVDDAIGSVANYFKLHGWEPGASVIYKAESTQKEATKTLKQSKKAPKPQYSLTEVNNAGFKPVQNVNLAKEKLALVTLEGSDGEEHFLGLNNFYVITRYNHSNHYAMAVYQLSQRLKSAKEEARS